MRASKKPRNSQTTSPSNSPSETRTSVTTVEQTWAGPLPPPAVLEGFGRIVENGAERIFTQWEQEASHRRKYEMMSMRWSMALDGIGHVLAFIFAMSALAVAAWAASINQPWVATVLGGGTIAAVVAALVYRGSKRSKTTDGSQRALHTR